MAYQPMALTWEAKFEHRSASLSVVGPGGFTYHREFGSLKPAFDLAALTGLADGQYKFEIVFGARPDALLDEGDWRARS